MFLHPLCLILIPHLIVFKIYKNLLPPFIKSEVASLPSLRYSATKGTELRPLRAVLTSKTEVSVGSTNQKSTFTDTGDGVSSVYSRRKSASTSEV